MRQVENNYVEHKRKTIFNIGMSLDGIRDILDTEKQVGPAIPYKHPKPGSVAVWSHIIIADGLELHASGLSVTLYHKLRALELICKLMGWFDANAIEHTSEIPAIPKS